MPGFFCFYLSQNVSDSELEKMFYDKFNMTLSDVQILLAEKSEEQDISKYFTQQSIPEWRFNFCQ